MANPLDRFTNLAQTTLSGGIDGATNPVTVPVTSATGFPTTGNYRVLIGNELFHITSGAGTTSWTATRPVEQTSIAAHIAGDQVTHVLTAFETNSFRQEYNVVAYGAVGDGVADDVSAFQTCINDAHVAGAPIYVPTATYKIGSALTTYSNVVFLTSGAVFTGTGASSVAPIINMTLNGTVLGVMISPSGLTGAISASRWVGATASGSPASGTFSVGDWVITLDGKIYICTVAGTPGTWVQPAPALTFGSAGDIQPLAAAAVAGSTGKVADAGHQHPTTSAQTWAALQTFSAGIALGSTAITKTRNANDNLPILGSGTGTANGVQVWITSTDPTSAANNGDVWFDG